MNRYIVLRLRGPLMAFGDVAVDEIRPSSTLPGMSMITGLLANALGYRYIETDLLARLQDRLCLAARLDRQGRELLDYQTAEVRNKERAWRVGSPPYIERSFDGKHSLQTLQRYPYYRADAGVSVALRLDPADESPTLDEIAQALAHPARPLFLGRCCCPPAEPLFRGEWVEADSPKEALASIAPLAWADGAEAFEAEWPAGRDDIQRGWRAEGGGRLMERRDLRDWRSDIHSGWRYVVRGPVALAKDTQGGRQP